MKIFVKTPTGKTIAITFESALTVLDVKHKIQEYEGIPCDQQRLNFTAAQLQDGQTLAACGIGEQSMIQLALHMGESFERSGAGNPTSMRVDPEYLVLFLKIRIHEQKGIPIEQQMLILDGKCLDDDRRCKEYGIDAESQIRLLAVEKPFECSVCKEDFQPQGDLAPHCLMCGHSFCHRDLRALIEEEKVSCPVCTLETDMNLCVGGFPARNLNLLESLDRSVEYWGTSAKDAIPMCSNCDDDANQRQATIVCTSCSLDLCDKCDVQIHAIKAFRSHQRSPVASSSSSVAKCCVHGEARKRFCIDCQILVCSACVLAEGSHHGHNHRLVSAIVSEEKKKIRDQTARCFESCCDLQELTTALRGVEKGLEANKNTCLAAFRADKDVAIAAIHSRWRAIEQAVEAEVQARQRTVRMQREAAEGGLWRTDACKREALAAVAATDAKFLAGAAAFSDRLEECNTVADQLLEGAGAEVPSMAVDYGTAEDGRGEHVAALLQAIAAFNLSLKPLEPPRSIRTCYFGTGELGDLVVQGVVTVPSDQVLQYAHVTVRPGGSLRVAAWDGTSGSGGELRVYVRGRLEVEAGGSIDLSGLGYRGGESDKSDFNNNQSQQGETSMGVGGASTAANGGGGGGGRACGRFGSGEGSVGGGGGGYGTAGADSEPNRHINGNNPGGVGGLVHGSAELADDEMLKGNGGGGGSGYGGTYSIGGAGGAGGGLVLVRSRIFCNRGEIKCNGAAGVAGTGAHWSSGGGGGSGGSLKVAAATFEHVGVISAEGGPAGPVGNNSGHSGICSSGGCGGVGRIRLEVVTGAASTIAARGGGAPSGVGAATSGSRASATAAGAIPVGLDLSRVVPRPSMAS